MMINVLPIPAGIWSDTLCVKLKTIAATVYLNMFNALFKIMRLEARPDS